MHEFIHTEHGELVKTDIFICEYFVAMGHSAHNFILLQIEEAF